MENDKLVWERAGDWERDPQGGETGYVAAGIWEGLDVDEETRLEVFWLTIGDWHLDPQGEVVVEVWGGLDAETVEEWVFWLTIGDWHPDPQGGQGGDVAVGFWVGLNVEGEMTVEVLWVTIGD